MPLVIREIEEVDRQWEPKDRRRKDRRTIKSKSNRTPELEMAVKPDIDHQSTKTTPIEVATDSAVCGNTNEPQEPMPSKRSPGFY